MSMRNMEENRMKQALRLTMAASLMLLSTAGDAGINGTQNKSVSAAAHNGLSFPAGTTLAESAVIVKPRPKRVLLVDATLQVVTMAGSGDTIRMYPRINGSMGVDPDTSTPLNNAVTKICTSAAGGDYPTCSLTGTWWLDLDAAAGIAPALLDAPLQVDLMVETPAGNVTSANVYLRTHILKK